MNVEGESMVVRGELGGRRPGLGTDDDKMCEYEGTRGSVGHGRADRDEAGRKRGECRDPLRYLLALRRTEEGPASEAR